MNRYFFFIFLLVFKVTYQAVINDENLIPRPRQRIFNFKRLFSWNICGNNSAVVFPKIENVDDIDGQIPKLLMQLDPFDSKSLFDLYASTGSDLDHFSNLCPDLVLYISHYLSFEETLTLRCVNRTFLIHHIQHNRFLLYKALSKNVSNGFDIFHNSTVACSYLNQLTQPIAELFIIDPTDSISVFRPEFRTQLLDLKEKANSSNDIKDYLIYGLFLYRPTDLPAFWDLIEALIKGNVLPLNDLIKSSGILIEVLFNSACQRGLVCIVKALLQSNRPISDVIIHTGLFSCITNNRPKLFKTIISMATTLRLENGPLNNLFETAVSRERIEIVKLLLEWYPSLRTSPSNSLFFAVVAKNIELVQILLEARGGRDFNLICSTGFSLMEYAIKNNFPEAIDSFYGYSNCQQQLKSIESIQIAIRYTSNRALLKILSKFDHPIDDVFSKQDVSTLLRACLVNENLFALRHLLRCTSSKKISEFKLIYSNEFKKRCSSNLYHYAVENENTNEFETLVSHFGSNSLIETNGVGLTPFALAVITQNDYFVHLIHKLNPSSIHIQDLWGNTALHHLFIKKYPENFVRTVAKYNFNWTTINENMETPIDLINNSRHDIDRELLCYLYQLAIKKHF